MDSKVLIKLIVYEMNSSFDVFIPVNEYIWKIKKLLVKSIGDLNNIRIDINKECILLNKDNNKIYSNNDIVIDTDIRNGTEIVLMFR
ncbi:MAG: hypothetical protein J6K21_00370 [Bacilli bacterium]|nr:hypothetical protein [Bacilli bacterium]